MRPKLYLGNELITDLYLGSNPIQIWKKGNPQPRLIADFNPLTEEQITSLLRTLEPMLGEQYNMVITLYSNDTPIHSGTGGIDGMKFNTLLEEVNLGQPVYIANDVTGTMTAGEDFTKYQIKSTTGHLDITQVVFINESLNEELTRRTYISKMVEDNVAIKTITFDSANIAFVQAPITWNIIKQTNGTQTSIEQVAGGTEYIPYQSSMYTIGIFLPESNSTTNPQDITVQKYYMGSPSGDPVTLSRGETKQFGVGSPISQVYLTYTSWSTLTSNLISPL